MTNNIQDDKSTNDEKADGQKITEKEVEENEDDKDDTSDGKNDKK